MNKNVAISLLLIAATSLQACTPSSSLLKDKGYTFKLFPKEKHLLNTDTQLSNLYHYWQQDPNKAEAYAEKNGIKLNNDLVFVGSVKG